MIIPGKKTLKRRMTEGEVLFGTFYKFNNAHLTEMLGLAGFDFIIVDGEHSTYSYNEMLDTVRAANGVGMDAVVRVPSGLPEHVLHACDLGAQGVQVPSLTDAADARVVVDAMRYFPVGHRGFATTTRAARYTFCDPQEFLAYSNNELLCVIMVERLKMVEQLEALCAIPSVDVLFIGAGDLSQEVGKPGQTGCREVLEIAKRITDTALARGKFVGMYCATLADVERAIGWGMRYVAFSAELNMIASKFRETVASLHALRDAKGTGG
jgi:4-hydroxy-2-oxoheptanedioate aldolase